MSLRSQVFGERWIAVEDFLRDEGGQDLIEYALVGALVALGAVASIKTVSTAIAGLFTSITTRLNAAVK